MSLSSSHCDEYLVTMDWAIGFEACREAVQAAELLIDTANAKKLLIERLKQAGWKADGPFELGFFNMSALQMDAICQVNYKIFGSAWDTLDDIYGALGRASLKVGVIGTAYSEFNTASGRHEHKFRITHIGFYIRDNYDFNGSQFLGTWTENRVMTKAETVGTMTSVGQIIFQIAAGPFSTISNEDFRNYRMKTGKGGDFVIYSTILWRRHEQIISLGDLI